MENKMHIFIEIELGSEQSNERSSIVTFIMVPMLQSVNGTEISPSLLDVGSTFQMSIGIWHICKHFCVDQIREIVQH
jgi:hypothetical protein